jgi:hypothetical protein
MNEVTDFKENELFTTFIFNFSLYITVSNKIILFHKPSLYDDNMTDD